MSIERVRCAYCREIVATVDTDMLMTPLRGTMFVPLHFELGGHPMFSEHSDWQSLFCVKNAVLHPGAHRIVKEDGVVEFEDGTFWVDGEIVDPRYKPPNLWEQDPDLDAEWDRRMKATTQAAQEEKSAQAAELKKSPGRPRKHDSATTKRKPGRPSKKKG